MKKLFSILVIGFTLAFSTQKAEAQSTSVSQPFAMLDSACFAFKPYYNSKNLFYMQRDSFAIANGYTYLNYPVKDTVRFARQRSLMIQVSNTQPVGSFELIVHKDSTGTVNACKAYLEGSNDGSNFTRLNDTLTCTNITTNSHIWVLPSPNKAVGSGATTSAYKDNPYESMPFLYYHILFVGVATGKVDLNAFFVPRHRSTSPN